AVHGTVTMSEKNLDMDVEEGSIASVEGASGVGKSTLLHIIGTIDSATTGDIKIHGRDVHSMSQSEKEMFRARSLGFIFQHHYLLPDFTVLENVMMPLLITRESQIKSREHAEQALSWVGLSHRLNHYPSQISGGEMARAGVARALVGGKRLILADEPTGNLDKNNSDRLADLIWQLQSELKFTLMIVTHDRDLAERVPLRYRLTAGKLARI
ncbi:MAG TPA: ATP-binding cassette domain-containing protein, partial [Leptospiraceae bacterium]|nr:ATP-binding cassette domain-containing protein [Leptospiraceae bacterium]